MINRGVSQAEISGPARKLFCSARPGIKLQNLYNGLNMLEGGGAKTHENFVKYGYNLWFY